MQYLAETVQGTALPGMHDKYLILHILMNIDYVCIGTRMCIRPKLLGESVSNKSQSDE